VDKDKSRHIRSDKFDDVPRIRELVHIFEAKFLHVDSVWLLKKMSSNNGFQGWHRDFALGQKITTTIVVNVGCVEDDTKRYHDPVGISIRKGKEYDPIPRCQYCKNGISHNIWHVINWVKRKGKGYNVNQIHIFHAKLALSDDEFQLLLRLLKSSSASDTEIKQLRSAWIQSMHQGMRKGAEMGSTRMSSRE